MIFATMSENGVFLAIDVGGTNFRILIVRIQDKKTKIDEFKEQIPQELLQGTGDNVSIASDLV